MNDLEVSRLRGMARDVQSISDLNGWPLPPAVVKTLALAQEAKRVAREIGLDTAADPDPAKPADVVKWVTKEAVRRSQIADQRKVAQELADRLDLDSVRMVLECSVSLLEHLRDQFAEQSTRFLASVDSAPTEVTGSTTPDEFAAFSAVAQAAEGMTHGLAYRARLAEILGEEAAVKTPLWLALAPTDDSSLFAVRELVTKYTDGAMPTTTEEWRRVAEAGELQLARRNEAEARASRYVEASWHGGMGPDGGMVDKTYAQAFALANTAGPLLASQPNVEAM